MTWPELASFLGLGVLSNTIFPVPFEPILLAFTGGMTAGSLALMCLVGSGCAGVGALLDASYLGAIRRRIQRVESRRSMERSADSRFYLLAAAAGLLPIPFTLVRAAILRVRPRPIVLAGIIAVTRFPRYLVTVYAWEVLSLPPWAAWVLVGTLVVIALQMRHEAMAAPLSFRRGPVGSGSGRRTPCPIH